MTEMSFREITHDGKGVRGDTPAGSSHSRSRTLIQAMPERVVFMVAERTSGGTELATFDPNLACRVSPAAQLTKDSLQVRRERRLS